MRIVLARTKSYPQIEHFVLKSRIKEKIAAFKDVLHVALYIVQGYLYWDVSYLDHRDLYFVFCC